MTRFRIVFTLFLALIAAPALFAANPSARQAAQLVYDPVTTFSYLYGGLSATDAGTAKAYDIDETWAWAGDHWVQLYPAHTPGGRSFHSFTWDYTRNTAILFGGKQGTTDLNDTWTFDGTDWKQLSPATSPSARVLGGMTFDRDRGVAVLFGGQFTTADGKTTTQLYDTWEFNGTTWTQRNTDGPKLSTPALMYDADNKTTYLLGSDTDAKPHWYSYNATAGTWSEVTSSTLPDCAVEAVMAYDEENKTIVVYPGTCSSSSITGETYEWDGSNFTKVTPSATIARVTGAAMTYDASRKVTLLFGGLQAFGSVQSATYVYASKLWATAPDTSTTPGPRSLYVMVTDPVSKVIWLYGGLSDMDLLSDLWKYHDGQWEKVQADNPPTLCSTPNGVWDTKRNLLVIVCSDSSVHEFDGTNWNNIDTSKLNKKPQTRRFSSAAYDQSLQKMVLFGGWNETNYIDDTWMWDGSTWTQVTKNLPFDRSHAAMWYDPSLKKTVIFGGIGQQSRDARIERFQDMWSFDGSGWTQMKNVTSTPGQRYGASVTVDPQTNLVYLFGGLKLNVNGLAQTQTYDNELWKWDGSTWSKVQTANAPPPRENAQIAFDPTTHDLMTFAGWAGFYRSDVWLFRNGDWMLVPEALPQPQVAPVPELGGRRRGVRH